MDDACSKFENLLVTQQIHSTYQTISIEKMEIKLTSADPFAAALGSIQTRVELHGHQTKINYQNEIKKSVTRKQIEKGRRCQLSEMSDRSYKEANGALFG